MYLGGLVCPPSSERLRHEGAREPSEVGTLERSVDRVFEPFAGLELGLHRGRNLDSAPVAGLRPWTPCAWTRRTCRSRPGGPSSPFFRELVTASKTASTASPACALVMPAPSATTPIRSFLFIAFPHSEKARPLGEPNRGNPFDDSKRNARNSGRFALVTAAATLMKPEKMRVNRKRRHSGRKRPDSLVFPPSTGRIRRGAALRIVSMGGRAIR